jgi:PAS domain S-box-containing protein
MRYSVKSLFRRRKSTFSDVWFEIVKTRFVLCLVIILFSSFTSGALELRYVLAATAVYAAFNFVLGFRDSSQLQPKRIRAIPALVDVLFISILVYLTGGQNSPWFLLYFFPIISVSRYLSYEGGLPLMALAVGGYVLAVHASGRVGAYSTLTLKCLVFLGIALVAGNLTRGRQREEDNLLEIFKEIDNAILDNSATNTVLRLILRKALELTRSDMAQMTILSTGYIAAYTITESPKYEWNVDSITERFCKKSIDSKKSFSVLLIKGKKETNGESSEDVEDIKAHHIYILKAYVEGAEQLPKSALFIPLTLNDEVKAVISLYSQHKFHYSATEAVKLRSFAPSLGIALKNYEMYQEITDSEDEKKARLKMLYEIGEQLKVEQGLAEVFKKVVELTYNQLNSEEAALFILDEENGNVLKKVAVKGPTEEITKKLLNIERPYKPGRSLVGRIFRKKKPIHFNNVPSYVKYQRQYSETLPSGEVRHYIGVPLIIGEEVLGVIRVINKKEETFSTELADYKLSKRGFDEEDVELLETIASQIASAIRSAKFIEVQRFHQELVENSPDPIIVLDKKGRVRIFNKACEKIWDYKASDVVGQRVAKYYESEAHAVEIGELLKKSEGHRIQDHRARIKARSGEIIPINLAASLLFDSRGEKIGSIGVFKDMRDTLRLQEEMTNAAKLAALGKLAHTIGHEIKHDIATGLNYIDTLAYECTDEELSEIYRDIQESLNEAVDKFQNMLMIGRPKPPERRLISHEDIFHRVEASLRRRADSRNIDFVVNSPQSAHELEADVEQIKQVISNLFDNSIDAIGAKKSMGGRGRIELSAQASNGDLHIMWRDNGCGISPARLPLLFTPFTTTKATGTGLGLFIVKNIIENHGGNISVESEEGKGTSFKIVLPLYKKAS